jgi:hypothetical protein
MVERLQAAARCSPSAVGSCSAGCVCMMPRAAMFCLFFLGLGAVRGAAFARLRAAAATHSLRGLHREVCFTLKRLPQHVLR